MSNVEVPNEFEKTYIKNDQHEEIFYNYNSFGDVPCCGLC